MKKIFFAILIASVYSVCSFGQTDTTLRFPLNKMKVNFAVPDIPAFKSLGIEPSKILRPSTPEALSVIIPQFMNNGNVVLPSSFALEASPALLINAHKKELPTLNTFIKQRALNSLRISLATGKDSTKSQPNAMKLGLGLRLSLINKGDLKYDKGFIAKKGMILSDIAKEDFEDDDLYMKKNKMNVVAFQNANIPDSVVHEFAQKLRIYQLINDIKMDSVMNISNENINIELRKNGISLENFQEVKDNNKKLIARLKGKSYQDKQAIYLQQLQELKEEYKRNSWNAERLDIATSVVWRSPDNFAKSLEYNSVSFWATYAKPCKTWGQWLLGLNISNSIILNEVTKVSKDFTQVSLSSRLYAGTNEMKGFIEGQYVYNEFNKSDNYFLQIGGEYAIRDGIWLQAYGGYQKGNTISQVVSNLDFRFTLPEK
jgi:hypothetical protein